MAQPSNKSKDSPYVGPRSIKARECFFGRDKAITQLVERLLANHVVLLHALSGAGKTSLIQAGIVPQLQKQGFQVMPVIRVNRRLQGAKQPAVNPYILSTLLSLERAFPRTSRLPRQQLYGLSFAEFLKLHLPSTTTSEPWKRVLLIFDQFEEILSLNQADTADKRAFFAWLMPVLLDARYYVLFSMRDDYVGGLEPYLGYFPGRLTSRFRLEFLDAASAQEAIQKPASAKGVQFQDTAARALISELSKTTIYTSEGSPQIVDGISVEPIQLQVVCLKLWNAPRQDPEQITEQDVRTSGNVDTALQDYYDGALNSITQGNIREERILRDWIQHQLIIEDTYRFQSHYRYLTRYGMTEALVRQLVDAHLVRSEQRLGATWYELSHDRMVRPIVSANDRWRKRSLKDWQLAAERWDREGRAADSGLLLKGEALKTARARFNPTRDSQVDLEFIQASEKAHQTQSARWIDPQRLQRVKLGTNLDEVGWGIIFAEDASPDLAEALKELIEHRREQASLNREQFFHVFDKENGYRPGETAQTFLRRNGATGGLPNPEKVPYYLLLVGDPQSIPYEFQYGLDQQYAVGRIAFDRLEQYQSYARSVRVCEGGTVKLPNQAVIFSPSFTGDQTTKLLSQVFTGPLYENLQETPNWQMNLVKGSEASRAGMNGLLGGPRTPAVLISATHVYTALDQADWEEQLGGLLCADWNGHDPLNPEHFFTARDIDDKNGRLLGLIAMLYGGYTAGASKANDFRFQSSANLKPAPRDLLARLPQRLLGHPHGGALAVIGHVDMAWTFSFTDLAGSSEISLYQELVRRLMQGYTVGAAMELLNQRFTRLNDTLQQILQGVQFYEQKVERNRLLNLMTTVLDARNYILLGDPAVRLPVDPNQPYTDPGPTWHRPEIEPVTALTMRSTPSSLTSSSPQDAQPDANLQWLFTSGLMAGSGEYTLPPLSTGDLMTLLSGKGLK